LLEPKLYFKQNTYEWYALILYMQNKNNNFLNNLSYASYVQVTKQVQDKSPRLNAHIHPLATITRVSELVCGIFRVTALNLHKHDIDI